MLDKFIPPYRLNIPVLFLVFNRLGTTKQVFKAIQEAKPPRLYIAADGARDSKKGEGEKVTAVREFILSSIDWECEVKTLFRKSNVGCGPNVKSSIDWFFEYEEMGIILEDDVCPVQSFFWFCEELLIKHKADERIGMIAGTNHIGHTAFEESYTFSKYKACWGWATWKRSWKNMDFEMSWLSTKNKSNIIRNMGYSRYSEQHWNNAIGLIENNMVSAWDWQWYFSLASQGQLCIFPKYNLVANIGFGEDATHTFGKAADEFIKVYELDFPVNHPKYVLTNSTYDKLFENKKIKSSPWSWKLYIPKSIKMYLKLLIYGKK